MKRLPLLLGVAALILLAASTAYWVLQLYKPVQRPLAAPPVAALPEPSADAAATLFGGQAATAVVSNYQLTGVVVAGRDSVAIIIADGAPPKALRLGREIAPGVTVSEVYPRYVMLSDGGVLKRVDLATDAKASTGLSGGQPAGQPPQPDPNAPQTVPEPPMSPGPVQEPPQVGGQPPQGANQPPPPPQEPVQMPEPVRSPGSPVSQPPTSQ